MKRTSIGLICACGVLGLAAPTLGAPMAAARAAVTRGDPCATLAGSRWVAYVEPGTGAYTSVELWDLRPAVIGGSAINDLALRPYPNPIKGTMDWGRAAVTKFTACANVGGKARLSADWAAEPIYDVTLSSDGQTATIAGTNTRVDTTDLKGWAARAPN